MNDEQLLRYSRHILLEEIGIEAQQRLLESTILIVGAGGLGSPAALYLAASGIGRIVIADGDHVDATNLQRQIAHRGKRIGWPKASSAKVAMHGINDDIEVIAIDSRLDDEQLDDWAGRCAVVLDCTDDFATRHAINRACASHGTPLVSGSAIRFDGQVAVFDLRDPDSACYHCVFPADQQVATVDCATMGVFAPLTGIIGTLQAAEALKLAGGFGEPAAGRLQMLDALRMRWTDIGLRKSPHCPVCGARPAISRAGRPPSESP